VVGEVPGLGLAAGGREGEGGQETAEKDESAVERKRAGHDAILRGRDFEAGNSP
jgi:hypothetical protein